ncbi:MAG: hypothetical protein ABL908_21535 [Hyphomicrobium sp.]
MIHDVIQYLSTHPGILATLLLFLFLALVGGWYVLYNYYKLILVTLLCAGGFASGVLVLYRGAQGNARDLIVIGLFLLVVFPIVFYQALQTSKVAYGTKAPTADKGPSPTDKGHARRAGV